MVLVAVVLMTARRLQKAPPARSKRRVRAGWLVLGNNKLVMYATIARGSKDVEAAWWLAAVGWESSTYG